MFGIDSSTALEAMFYMFVYQTGEETDVSHVNLQKTRFHKAQCLGKLKNWLRLALSCGCTGSP